LRIIRIRIILMRMQTTNGSCLDMPDDEFLAAFERGALPASDFRHRAHLRMAWLYTRRLSAAEAVERAALGIRRLAAAHGQHSLYHDTLTRAWVHLVASASAQEPSEPFDTMLQRRPELLDKLLLLRYFSAGLLWSDEARDHWVEPDLAPLTGTGPATGESR
jgi:hypothetical protein